MGGYRERGLSLMTRNTKADVASAVRDLEERERRFRAVFESALDAITIFDDEGRVLEANFAAAALFGVSPEAFPGRLLDDFTSSLAEGRRVWAEFRSAGRHRGDLEIVRADGERRLVETSVTANFVPGQHVSVVRDVTDRRKSESDRLRLAERFERLFRTDLVGMVLLNRQTGQVSACNRKLAEFFGRSPEDFVGRHVTELETFFADREHYQQLLVAWASGAPIRGVAVRSALPDGSMRRGVVTLETLPDLDGQGVVDVAVLVDVTEEHRLEIELRRAQRLEAIGRLAGGIAHDFDNLLGVISGCSELLEEAVAGHSGGRESLYEIKRAAGRAVRLTHGLLAFSRQEAFDVRTVDLNDVLRRCEGPLQDLLGPQVQVTLRLSAETPFVQTDSLQLEHVLLQLATNARDAMPDGGAFTIETSHEGAEVRLSVTDTGMGMEPATLERVFEPFNTTKTMGTGIGLGLSTVYGIVTQSGGRITADSEPAQGTSIQIFLPVVSSVPADEVAAPARDAAPITGTETILLAEEEASVALLIESFMTRLGYRVIHVSTVAGALRTAHEYGRRIDLVIASTPVVAGQDNLLLEELRTSRPDLPALVISGFSPDTAAAASATAHSACLTKPFAMADLVRLVRKLLDEGA
jgi:two-component system cell cycle sensor histidine kinase/response regulator CckA